MAHTQDAVIYDPLTGNVAMIVIPDDDTQLGDPAFNPKGLTQLRVPSSSDPVSNAAKINSKIKLPVTTAASVGVALGNVSVSQ